VCVHFVARLNKHVLISHTYVCLHVQTPYFQQVDQTHTFRFVPALRGIGTRLVAAGLHHSMAITATEHVYVWGGLTAKKDPLKVSHRPSVVPLLSGRQPQVSTGNGCAHHALVTTFDVLGPLLIVFDEPASRVRVNYRMERKWGQ